MAFEEHFAWMVNQAAHIEREVYKIKYPDIRYPQLASIDTSIDEWTNEIVYHVMDKHGRAEYMHVQADDLPMVDIKMEQKYVRVAALWAGYRYNVAEIEYARKVGINLGTEKAEMVRRAHEEAIDEIFLDGNSDLGWDSFWNSSLVTKANAPSGGGSRTTKWSSKNGEEIIKDINDAIVGIYDDTKTIEMANTVLLPIEQFNLLANKNAGFSTDTSVLEWLKKHNVYTSQTGQPLMIRQLRGLDGKGASDTDRMIVYNRSPEVLKFHLPMPVKFGDVQRNLYTFVVPSMCRIGGLEIRRPKAMRYIDAI